MIDSKNMNWQMLAVFAMGAYIVYSSQQPATPKPDDTIPVVNMPITKVLDGVYKQDRTDRLQVLKELSAKDFASDKSKLDWYNTEATARRIKTNTPFTDRVAEAIFGQRLAELIRQLESGR